MYRFPANLKSIADPAKFKEYCLNPLGIKVPIRKTKARTPSLEAKAPKS